MDDQKFQSQDPAGADFDHPSSKLDDARARHPTVSTLLGLLVGDSDAPREGQRDIIASAIRRALEISSTSELPSLARLIGSAGLGELDQRTARCRERDILVRGKYQDVPVLALCAEIHRHGFVDVDGKEARCKLFLALVDLAISCPELLESNSFKSAIAGLRLQLERLAESPKGGSATRHFSVWQLFEWVEKHADFADYVKTAIRALRPRFLLAWRSFDPVKDDDVADGDQAEEPVQEEASPNETFWLLPESTQYECELPPDLKKKLLATELTRITALSRYASASLLVRTDVEMKSVVADLLVVAKSKSAEAPHALAQLLALSTGITVDSAYRIKCADPTDFTSAPPYPGIITLDAGWLIRSEFDPRQKAGDRFDPHTVHVPIPESLAALLRDQPGGIVAGGHGIHMPIGVAMRKSPRQESAWFTTIASRLMRDGKYGVSLAQHALHTSLGLDTAPLHYDRIPASYIAHAMARVTHPWFGCPARPRASGMPQHNIGSQRVIEMSDCKDFFTSLRAEWSPLLPLSMRIHLRSRNLRNGMLLAVCSRTNTSIERIVLADISYAHMLMTIADKAVALDHASRLAALSKNLVRELKEYLAELHEATRAYPNTQLATYAAGVIEGREPLFLNVESAENCRAMALEDHAADQPPSASDIANWARHLGNACLTDLLPEPLRVAQMGWCGTRAGAISELSTESPVEVMARISTAVDDMLKRCGWAPLPGSGLQQRAALLPPVNWRRAYADHEHAFEAGLRQLKARTAIARREFAGEVIPGINAFFRTNAIPLVAVEDGLKRHETTAVVPVSREMHKAMLRIMTSDARSEMLSRELIHEWIKRARQEKHISGPLPKHVARVRPSEPGPFVAHAHRSLDHRTVVLEVARQSAMSVSARTFLTVLMEGWVPDASAILELMTPGASLHDLPGTDHLLIEAAHAQPNGGTSLPMGCLAFDGAAALALRAWHRSGIATSPSADALRAELHSTLSPILSAEIDEQSIMKELEALMSTCHALRAPGVMRDVATRRIVPAFAPIARVVALHEDHPIWPTEFQALSAEGVAGGARKSRKRKSAKEYSKVKEILSRLVDRWAPSVDETARSEAIVALRLLVPNGVPRTGVQTVALYAAAYLTEGLNKQNVRPITVQGAVYSVGEALIAALPEQMDLSRTEAWQLAYARALDNCQESNRSRLARDLNHFQKVMSREYGLPVVGLAPLLAGMRVPNPPEPIGFLTSAEQAAVVFAARMRVESYAVNGSPMEQQAALAMLAITALAFSTSMRDREVRVPQMKAWRAGVSPRIELRSNGQDFVKSEASRRAIHPRGTYAPLAVEATERLVQRKTATHEYEREEKLLAPSPGLMDTPGVSEMMRQINADIRHVTGIPQAAIDVSRKTWALGEFRSLGRQANSLWPTRDMLAEMGQSGISTMLGYYLHEPVAFVERYGTQDELPASYAGWILGMVPRSATRLLSQRKSWLRPGDPWIVASTPTAFEFSADESTRTFSPGLSDVEAILGLIAGNQSVASSVGILGWPTNLISAIERALDALREKGVVLGGESTSGMGHLAPPIRVHGSEALEACRRDAHCWDGMAWIFDQWLSDWRKRDRKGFTARRSDWERQIVEASPVRGLPWNTLPDGHSTFFQLAGARKHGHSAWNALRWLALTAWILQRLRR